MITVSLRANSSCRLRVSASASALAPGGRGTSSVRARASAPRAVSGNNARYEYPTARAPSRSTNSFARTRSSAAVSAFLPWTVRAETGLAAQPQTHIPKATSERRCVRRFIAKARKICCCVRNCSLPGLATLAERLLRCVCNNTETIFSITLPAIKNCQASARRDADTVIFWLLRARYRKPGIRAQH